MVHLFINVINIELPAVNFFSPSSLNQTITMHAEPKQILPSAFDKKM